MGNQFPVEYLLYFYMFICAALLFFNVVYILGGRGRERRQAARLRWWRQELGAQLRAPGAIGRRHTRLIIRRLRSVSQLMAYSAAAEECEAKLPPETMRAYFEAAGLSFQELAAWYAGRDSMERAYFAWFTARFRPYRERQRMFRLILVGYLDDATVYCRENVLQALYASGDEEVVATAFQFMNDRRVFHHAKLLADGLQHFTGDKEALARRLWSHHENWDSMLLVGVAQFITGCSGAFRQEFLEVLRRTDADRELRLAVLRYLRRYPFEPAREVLQHLTLEHEGDELAIVAAFALDRYPGEDTVDVLERALCSRNWYVRANAAVSLIHLGVGGDVLRRLEDGGDRYAREMMEYQLQRNVQRSAKKEAVA